MAATNDPERIFAALEPTVVTPVVVAEAVGLRLVLSPPVAVELLVEDPVAVAVEALPVTLAPDPPAPEGESPEPELTIAPPVAAVDWEEAALAKEEPVAVADFTPPAPDEVAVEEAELLVAEVTLEQERSKRGVELRGVPGAMPKLGLGVALLSVSSRVYHQVLTTPKLGHPTWSQ